MDIFERWIKDLDLKMGHQGHHILLLVDNFSGHYISYTPCNIRIKFFEPNMTLFVQPCDAGIIRCLKAHYCRAFCMRALDLEELEERDIYKIQLNEAMYLAKDAWDAVSQEIIAHCWMHTKIQLETSLQIDSASHGPLSDPAAWRIIQDFAVSDSTLLQVEDKLKAHLDNHYRWDDWSPAFNAVMEAERDVAKALENLSKLTMKFLGCTVSNLPMGTMSTDPAPIHPPADLQAAPPQLKELENGLQDAVNKLKQHKRIIGTLLTLDEMLNPVEETEIGMSQYRFDGGDAEIVATVQHEMAVQNGETIEIDSDEEEEEEEVVVVEEGNKEEKLGAQASTKLPSSFTSPELSIDQFIPQSHPPLSRCLSMMTYPPLLYL
ncbi:hypothetical protein M422DRAFT_55619 [Sphaerobolus stellatus SS14]|uniref:DDE-1 domain-containing protein n=1 Tax=Sphaerobolus stellatus (strain SS14) TaxID=990650 RepID=A0A0C9TAR7_SPHS4|nr:hypothetical protein M422DRAFT_55619 [Sphaerobolus stellatus SS14]